MHSLIIEADAERRARLAMVLEERGHQVSEAEDFATACRVVAEELRPLIFVGIEDGERTWTGELDTQLRAARKCPGCMIVAVVDSLTDALAARVIESGADDVLDWSDSEAVFQARLELLERRVCKTAGTIGCDIQAMRRLTTLIDRSRAVVFLSRIEADLPAEFVSESIGRFGYSTDDLISGRVSLETMTHPDDRGVVWRGIQEALDRGDRRCDHKYRIVTASGEICHIEQEDLIVVDFDNRPTHLQGILFDVTEHRQVAKSLREKESQLSLIAATATDIVWTAVFDGLDELPTPANREEGMRIVEQILPTFRFTYVSPSIRRILGFWPEDVIGFGLDRALPPEAIAAVTEQFLDEVLLADEASRQSEPRMMFETAELTTDGSPRWGELIVSIPRSRPGQPVTLVGISRDVTERHLAEEALRKTRAIHECLIENMPDLLGVVDHQGRIQYVNRGVAGGPTSDLIGRTLCECLELGHESTCQDAVRGAFESGQVAEFDAPSAFGTWWRCRIVPLAQSDRPDEALWMATDMTDAKQAREETSQEQDLLRQLLELHERDRQMLALDLHDGFAQQLSGAVYSLQGFHGLLLADSDEAWNTFDSSLQLLRAAVVETRRLVDGLGPPGLDQFGVAWAIESLAAECRESNGIDVEFVSPADLCRLAQPLENALFRIAQETLNNARQHSRSSRVRLELTCQDAQVRLCTRDWGIGFDRTKISDTCFGLRGIRERARLLGGSASIESNPNMGTCVSVSLPMIRRAEPASAGSAERD